MFVSADSQRCMVGETYTLTVVYNGVTYVAAEQTPDANPIDTIASYYLPDNNGFITKGYYVFIQGVQSPAHDIFPSPAETLSCDPSAVRSPLAACRNEMRAAIADCLQQQRQKQTTTQATRPAR